MNEPLHSGGAVTVYQIEGQFPTDRLLRYYNAKWCERELSPKHFGERYPKYDEKWDTVCPIFREYGASGRCWQTTGMRGFLNRQMAELAFRKLVAHAPEDKHVARWRLVRREITVKKLVLADAAATGHQDPKPLKVYGTSLDGRHRHIVAARSRAEAFRAWGTTRGQSDRYTSETGNDVEIAIATSRPGVVFESDLNEKKFRPWTRQRTAP